MCQKVATRVTLFNPTLAQIKDLADYIFKNLNAGEKAEVKKFLDNNPDKDKANNNPPRNDKLTYIIFPILPIIGPKILPNEFAFVTANAPPIKNNIFTNILHFLRLHSTTKTLYQENRKRS